MLTPKSANTFLTFRHEIVVKFPSFFLGTYVEALGGPFFCPPPPQANVKKTETAAAAASLSSPSLFFASFLFMRETSLRHFSFFSTSFLLAGGGKENLPQRGGRETKEGRLGGKKEQSQFARKKKRSNFSAAKLECFFAGRKGVQENGKVRCAFCSLRRNSLRVVVASLLRRIEATSPRVREDSPQKAWPRVSHKWAQMGTRPPAAKSASLLPPPPGIISLGHRTELGRTSVGPRASKRFPSPNANRFVPKSRTQDDTQQPLLQLDGAGLGLLRLLLRRQKIFFAFTPSFVVCRYPPPPPGGGRLEEIEENSSSYLSCFFHYCCWATKGILPLLVIVIIFFIVSRPPSKEDRRKFLISRLYTGATRQKGERNNTGKKI